MNKEIWKDIPDYEGLYQVSNLGRVKSLKKYVWNGYKNILKKEKILIPRYNQKGYVSYALYKNNKRKDFKGHYLVISSFIKNEYKKEQINHKNGIKDDNRLCNLEYCTQQENIIDAYENGLFKNRKKKYKFNKQDKNKCLEKYRDIAIKKAKDKNSKEIYQFSILNTFIKKWNSVKDAERYYKRRIHIERKQSIGYIWKRKEDLNDNR